jgi:hypothetical protein
MLFAASCWRDGTPLYPVPRMAELADDVRAFLEEPRFAIIKTFGKV